MARYLSPAWLAELREAVVAPPGVILEQTVTGGPDGDVTYRIGSGGPVVTLEADYETAVAVSTGELSAQIAFMTGRLRVGGDLAALIEAQDALLAIDAAMSTIRAGTCY